MITIKFLLTFVVTGLLFFAFVGHASPVWAQDAIPNIVGTWVGKNLRISPKKGYLESEKVIIISEQRDRRFRGHFEFTYDGGLKRRDFVGIIFPDNKTLSWVGEKNKGYVFGEVIAPNRISSCYIEPGANATAGCAEMQRKTQAAGK